MKINTKNLINDTLKNLNLFISKKEKKGINLDNFKKYLKNTEFKNFVLILGGNQISGSLSPFIHNYGQFLLSETDKTVKTDKSFYILCNLEKYDLNTKEVLDFIKNNENIFGANITMPYKEEIFEILNNEKKLEKIAIEAGAVNTIFKKKGEVFGTNTDVIGIYTPIVEKDINLIFDSLINKKGINKNAYIFGAGGASRGAILALKAIGFSGVKIFNRSLKNAEKIKNEFENKDFKIEIIEYDLLNPEKNNIKKYFDKKGILINTLPFGFKEDFPKLVVKNEEFKEIFSKIDLYFDIVYDLEKGETPTIKKIQGELRSKRECPGVKENFPKIKICDGIDMILNQAVGGFEKWFCNGLDIKKIEKIIRK